MAGRQVSSIEGMARSLAGIVRNARLTWRLLGDGRVSAWLKLIPLAALVYVLLPFDFLPDFFPGLGQLDDVAILFLALRLFLHLVPREAVERQLRQMGAVEASYRVVAGEGSEDSSIEVKHRLLGD